jgi:predicted aminopeptidase
MRLRRRYRDSLEKGGRRCRLAVALLLLAGTSACSPFYVIRAGYEEAKLLRRRESIAELVRDSTTPPATREKLRLVLRARAFAEDSLGLDAEKSYTTFAQLDSDTLATIVSAAYKDRFQAYTWWFPIIGHVPYKGYFSERKAREAAENLEEKGLDTYIRPTSAFSTLGWFNDPLVSPLLRYDSVSLAGTVIHELLHNTVYLSGQTTFNESFAEFVGSRGAIMLFCGAEGEASPECRRARAIWHDELVFGRYLTGLVGELEALYARQDISSAEKIRLREQIFTRSQRSFTETVRPQFQVSSYASFAREPLNNALLIARRLYYHRLDLFDELYARNGGDLPRTIRVVLEATKGGGDPYAAVEGLLRR